jgi:hypothetical protein
MISNFTTLLPECKTPQKKRFGISMNKPLLPGELKITK